MHSVLPECVSFSVCRNRLGVRVGASSLWAMHAQGRACHAFRSFPAPEFAKLIARRESTFRGQSGTGKIDGRLNSTWKAE